jgi:maltooligosyltrehalose trehalohydrolase
LANSGSGARCQCLTSPSRYRAISALLLLAPQTPMLFQGQEFASSSPFFYFADHKSDISSQVAQGRAKFLAQFRSLATPEMQARLPDPGDPMTFVRSKLDHLERSMHAHEYALHCDLLRLRREDKIFRNPRPAGIDGAVIGPEAGVIRYFDEKGDDDRLLIFNLGRDLEIKPAPEPLLAPPEGKQWALMWSSEDPGYGGWGTAWSAEGNWRIQGEVALLLKPVARVPTDGKAAEMKK